MTGLTQFRIVRHRHWHGLPADVPQPSKVDPILRRRLSPQGRLALALAEAVIGDLARVRVVFASQHGELGRTHGLIESLRPEAVDDPSPSAFTLSVLNSTPSVLSIARRDTSPALALAAGPATPWYGLFEASGVQAECGSPVLLLCCDAPVPPVFIHGSVDSAPLRALAVLLSSGEGEAWSLTGPGEDGLGDAMLAMSQALDAGRGEWGGWGLRRR